MEACGGWQDIRENEGVDEDDPLNSIDDGIRFAPSRCQTLIANDMIVRPRS